MVATSQPGEASALGPVLQRLSQRFREGRFRRLRALIAGIAEARSGCGPLRIIGLGGRFEYWQAFGLDHLETLDVQILCVNAFEREIADINGRHPRISAEVGDACALHHYPDHAFDLVHSNSVIEHVGGYARKAMFAAEVRRLAPAYYVQTPCFRFPIDPHWPRMPFFHWLPMAWRYRLLMRFRLGWAGPYPSIVSAMTDLEGTTLIDWRQARDLFPDARLRAERLALLPKSVIAERLGEITGTGGTAGSHAPQRADAPAPGSAPPA